MGKNLVKISIFLLVTFKSYGQVELPLYPLCNDLNDISNIDTLILKSKNTLDVDTNLSFCLLYKANKLSKTKIEKAKITKIASKLSSKLYKTANYKDAIYFQSFTAQNWYELDSINQYTTSLRRLGFDYYRLGDIYNTIKYINIALELSKKNNQKWNEYLCLYQLAWANWRIENCDEAIKHIELAKKIIDAGPAKRQLASYYNSISNFYRCKGDIPQAIAFVDKAIAINKENNDINSYGVALTNKANYLIDYKSNPKKIISMVNEGIEINKEMNDMEQLGSNYGLLAKAYIYNKEYKKAIKSALKGEKITKKIGDLPRVLENYTFLKEAYTHKKDYLSALKYAEKHNTLYKKLYGKKNSNKIFELQQKNAIVISNNVIEKLKNEKELSELKNKQSTKNNWLITIISLLLIGAIISYFTGLKKTQKQNTEAQKKQLSHELLQMEMKALRARMNPHFLFNSLNSIKSYIATNKPREASNYLSKFATLMRMILDHSKQKTIPLNDELKAIQYYIDIEKMRLKNAFECELIIDKTLNLDEVFIPPSLIQPFIENSIWHGFSNLKEKGVLNIRVFPKKNATIVEIEDNGIGRKNAEKFKLKKGNHKSTGTKIIDNIVEVYGIGKLVNLQVQTVDLYNSKKSPLGTKIIITIANQYHE